MVYPDLVWAALVIAGGLLLIEDGSKLTRKQKAGVAMIFVGFLYQVYWDILHRTTAPAVTWNLESQIEVGYVTLLVVILIIRERKGLRKWISGISESMGNGKSIKKK